MKITSLLCSVCALLSVVTSLFGEPEPARAEVKNLSIDGGVDAGKARLVIEALLGSLSPQSDKLIYTTALEQSIQVGVDRLVHSVFLEFNILQGQPRELTLQLNGPGEIRRVEGGLLHDWSLRQDTNGNRTLAVRLRPGEAVGQRVAISLTAEQPLTNTSAVVTPLTFTPPNPALFSGYVALQAAPGIDIAASNISGLSRIQSALLPERIRPRSQPENAEPLAFQLHGSGYRLPLRITPLDPEMRAPLLRDCRLIARLGEQTAAFTLTGTARVKNPNGGSLRLLSGAVGLTAFEEHPEWRLRLESGEVLLMLARPGEFPIRIMFNAAVRPSDGWKKVAFRIAPSPLQQIVLQGLPADTRFQFEGAARPERVGEEFLSYVPADGSVDLSWKEDRAEGEGKLFYSAEMLSQINVSPGQMTEAMLLEFRVMQGEMNRVKLLLDGSGEVTRVQGDQVLGWKVQGIPGARARELVADLNQPQKDHFRLQIQMQTPLGPFPRSVDATQFRVEGATRFSGYCRVVNEGAVRLEIEQTTGLSQISPEKYPETASSRAFFRTAGTQRFAYRFSGGEFGIRIQADQILPELSVSQVLAYRLGENEFAIEAETELDVREAPLRELSLRIPKGYAVARLTASGLGDYFLREAADENVAQLRLVYAQPISGRQLIQLRLERNETLGAAVWELPRVEVELAKSVRGYIGVSAEPGFRLTLEGSESLTEVGTALFPRKESALQLAFRITESNWSARLRVERLGQTVQADALHLFSVGEGVAYGSSVLNYVISGAPVASFNIELSSEYSNIEFIGKDVRNWQRLTNGYSVQLHTPVTGAYTLLATYERPFKAQGETLTFTGARPLAVQSEQGHTLVISAYQFRVQPVEVSAGLLPLEVGEVPPEYRLLFDAPILAAYRYTSRPFNLRLALSPLA